MLSIRRAKDRGHANHGWLDSRHSFSFADYHDPEHMGFRALRVINEDRVQPGRGFATHPHRDMEILSYVLEGALEHRDSMGNGSVIRPGDVQRMSAGSGVTHSEFNASQREVVHFLQIWLLPTALGLAPSYAQKHFTREEKAGRLRLVASPDGADGCISIHTDARVYAGVFAAGERASLELAPGRHAWLQVARGRAHANGHDLGTGDGAALSGEAALRVEAADDCEILAFDLA
jgi:redox-sensitive bicupin YhaK (pirin superfamily)